MSNATGSLVNGTTTYTYDADDRITGESGPGGTATYSYDADGDETTVNGQAASYNWESRLYGLGTAQSPTATAGYFYDADDNRVASTAGGATTDYLVDTTVGFPSVAEERADAGGGLLARYTLGDDLLRMDRSGVASYYVEDGLGSTRALTNAAGAVTDTYNYDAYGETVAQAHPGGTATPNEFLFDAQQLDQPTGDYFLRARYYSESDGRFLSQDPYSGSNEDPISLHRYLYASNDPVDDIDPGGQDPDLPSFGAYAYGAVTLTGIATPAFVNSLENAEEETQAVSFQTTIGGQIGQLYSALPRLGGVFKNAFDVIGKYINSAGQYIGTPTADSNEGAAQQYIEDSGDTIVANENILLTWYRLFSPSFTGNSPKLVDFVAKTTDDDGEEAYTLLESKSSFGLNQVLECLGKNGKFIQSSEAMASLISKAGSGFVPNINRLVITYTSTGPGLLGGYQIIANPDDPGAQCLADSAGNILKLIIGNKDLPMTLVKL